MQMQEYYKDHRGKNQKDPSSHWLQCHTAEDLVGQSSHPTQERINSLLNLQWLLLLLFIYLFPVLLSSQLHFLPKSNVCLVTPWMELYVCICNCQRRQRAFHLCANLFRWKRDRHFNSWASMDKYVKGCEGSDHDLVFSINQGAQFEQSGL